MSRLYENILGTVKGAFILIIYACFSHTALHFRRAYLLTLNTVSSLKKHCNEVINKMWQLGLTKGTFKELRRHFFLLELNLLYRIDSTFLMIEINGTFRTVGVSYVQFIYILSCFGSSIFDCVEFIN